MAQGTLRCCGSSLFLKGLYGVGYNLTVVKTIEGTARECFEPDKRWYIPLTLFGLLWKEGLL
jgi:hypothetical protein